MNRFKETLAKIRDATVESLFIGAISTSLLPSIAIFGTYLAIGSIGVVGIINQGPIDLSRTVYSTVMGDSAKLKYDLLDYALKNARSLAPLATEQDVEERLAAELRYQALSSDGKRVDGKMDATRISTTKLWDLTERYPKNIYARWVWPSLKGQ